MARDYKRSLAEVAAVVRKLAESAVRRNQARLACNCCLSAPQLIGLMLAQRKT